MRYCNLKVPRLFDNVILFLLMTLSLMSVHVFAEEFSGREGTVNTYIYVDLTYNPSSTASVDGCGVASRDKGILTRGQALHELFNALGISTDGNYTSPPFYDVDTSHDYYKAIAYAYHQNIVSGVDNSGYFKPDCFVVRVEFMKMVMNTLGIIDLELSRFPDGSTPPFPDLDSSQWYYPYVYAAYNVGIIHGTDEDPSRLMPALALSIPEFNLIIERAKALVMSSSTVSYPEAQANQSIAAEALPYAQLSSAVYENGGSVPSDWSFLEKEDLKVEACSVFGLICYNIETGYYAAVYKNETTKTVAIVFRGSEPTYYGVDWWGANVHLLKDKSGQVGQYKFGLDFAERIKKQYPYTGDDGWKVRVTGHSLGGAIASYVGTILRLRTYTFNAAGLWLSAYPGFQPEEGLVKDFYSVSNENYILTKDPAYSYTGWHVGTPYPITYHSPQYKNMHSMSNMVIELRKLAQSGVSAVGNGSVFDGAGSLIKPTMKCWGCDKDEARMHPHSSEASTVVFQSLQESGGCPYLKIKSDRIVIEHGEEKYEPIKLEVSVSSKHWDSETSDRNYLATLPAIIPATIPRSDTDYTTTSITSKSPVSTPIRIVTECTTSDNSSNRQETSAIDATFSNGYTWVGNGSIISQAAKSCTYGYGCKQDWAIASNSKKALTAFQWQVSSSCRTLRIQLNGGGSFYGLLKYKGWDRSSWEDNSSISFPIDISKTSDGYYYVFAIETEAGAIPSGKYIEARCK